MHFQQSPSPNPLEHLSQGYQYKEIAEALSISTQTVWAHVRNIYEKLHMRSRTEAVVKHLGRGTGAPS